MKNRRWLVCALAAVMTAGMLTGCGSKTGAVLFMVQLRLRFGEDFLKAGLAVSKNIRFKAAIIR